jgi:hypothetical protein
MLPLMIILLASLVIGLGVQYSHSGSKNTELEVQEDSATEESNFEETPGLEQEESPDSARSESKDTATAEKNETSTTSPEPGDSKETSKETFNISSGILGQGSTTEGNLTSSTPSNATNKSSFALSERLGTATKAPFTLTPVPYKVKVTFDSMNVHHPHEGAFSGDGEFDMVVYVQGLRVKLTEASGPGSGLWDVSLGERVFFDEGTEITIETLMPLSIFTAGAEVDSCGRPAFPDNMQYAVLKALQAVNALEEIEAIQDSISQNINGGSCTLNLNDEVGVINQIYEPPGYLAGSHVDKSNGNTHYDSYSRRELVAPDTDGDFTLRYTISVIP